MRIPDLDDKDVAMIAIAILAIASVFLLKEASIITGGITAIAALATGRKNGGE